MGYETCYILHEALGLGVAELLPCFEKSSAENTGQARSATPNGPPMDELTQSIVTTARSLTEGPQLPDLR